MQKVFPRFSILMMAVFISSLLCTSAFATDDIPEFDGGYVKTVNNKYIELKEIKATKLYSLSGDKLYFVSDRAGIAVISSKDFKGFLIKSAEYMSRMSLGEQFSLRPLLKKIEKIDTKKRRIYQPGEEIELRKKGIGNDAYYYQPRNPLKSRDYVAWFGDIFWLFSISDNLEKIPDLIEVIKNEPRDSEIYKEAKNVLTQTERFCI